MPAQHVDTGELLMQAFADRHAVSETLQTGCATLLRLAWSCSAAEPYHKACLAIYWSRSGWCSSRGALCTTPFVSRLSCPVQGTQGASGRSQAGHFLQPLAQGALVQGRDLWALHQRPKRAPRLRPRLARLPQLADRPRLPHGMPPQLHAALCMTA